ncbi:MAG: cysteine--tRNA ligase [Pseudomonadota bacterium]
MLTLYNTLSRTKQAFEPLEPGKVKMYACGITIYDRCHIGHARALITYDIICRHLRATGWDVTYVRNITDVDDKIIARAEANGEAIDALTERYIAAMDEDAAALNVLPPDQQPRATQWIDRMIELIETLIDKGHAYPGDNGDVYYAVDTFDGYGKLSGRTLADQRAGERVAVDEHKRDPLDFVLWKAAKPGEPAWDSPWGAGRPGWHIECSAMAKHTLGPQFDIHGGGSDLIFPHHENEIAQSEAANGCALANYWLHNGMITRDGEKMSKSLGNFDTVRDLLAHHTGEEIRLFVVAAQYRSPLAFVASSLDQARASLTRLYSALRDAPAADDAALDVDAVARFDVAMNDDFNTPVALAVLFELAGTVNRALADGDPAGAVTAAHTLRSLGQRLGLLYLDAEAYLQRDTGSAGLSAARVDELVAERIAARGARDFARADAIRDELTAAGITLEDVDGQTRWRRG